MVACIYYDYGRKHGIPAHSECGSKFELCMLIVEGSLQWSTYFPGLEVPLQLIFFHRYFFETSVLNVLSREGGGVILFRE